MKLVLLQRAHEAGDWHIGYLDDRPAIGDHEGRWYIVDNDAVIHNPKSRLVWIVNHQSGGWECLSDKLWPREALAALPERKPSRPDFQE